MLLLNKLAGCFDLTNIHARHVAIGIAVRFEHLPHVYLLLSCLVFPKCACAQDDSLAERRLAHFAVEADGGPLIVPVQVEAQTQPRVGEPRSVLCYMLVDTGSAHTLFHTSMRKLLGRSTGTAHAGAPPDIETFRCPRLRLDKVSVQSLSDIGCLDLSGIARLFGERIDGVLGMDILGTFVCSIDFNGGDLCLYADSINERGAAAIKLTLSDTSLPNLPVATASAADGGRQSFLIDTGAVDTFSGTLSEAVFDRMADSGELIVMENAGIVTAVGGDLPMKFGRLRSLTMGGQTREKLLFGRFRISSLGLGYLSRYRVTFDFPKSVMYLKPGKNHARADSLDLSSMRVAKERGVAIAQFVYQNGAAARAGLLAGDKILSIDGHDTRGISLFRFRRYLRAVGEHEVVINRRGAEKRVALILGTANEAGSNRGQGKKADTRR